MTSPRLDLGTLCVLDTCDNQLHHEASDAMSNIWPVEARSPHERKLRLGE